MAEVTCLCSGTELKRLLRLAQRITRFHYKQDGKKISFTDWAIFSDGTLQVIFRIEGRKKEKKEFTNFKIQSLLDKEGNSAKEWKPWWE